MLAASPTAMKCPVAGRSVSVTALTVRQCSMSPKPSALTDVPSVVVVQVSPARRGVALTAGDPGPPPAVPVRALTVAQNSVPFSSAHTGWGLRPRITLKLAGRPIQLSTVTPGSAAPKIQYSTPGSVSQESTVRPSPGTAVTLVGGGAESPSLPQAASALASRAASVRRRIGWCMGSRRRIRRVYDSFVRRLAFPRSFPRWRSVEECEDVAPLGFGHRRDRQSIAAPEHDHVGQGGIGPQLRETEQPRLAQRAHLEHEPARIVGLAAGIVPGRLGIELGRIRLRRRSDLGDARDARLRAARMVEEHA